MTETPTERRLREMGETEKECQLSAQLTLATNDGLDDITRRHYHDYADERGRTAAAIDRGRQAIAMLRSALPHLESVEDEGPHGEGWQSDKLAALVRDVAALLAACQED